MSLNFIIVHMHRSKEHTKPSTISGARHLLRLLDYTLQIKMRILFTKTDATLVLQCPSLSFWDHIQSFLASAEHL